MNGSTKERMVYSALDLIAAQPETYPSAFFYGTAEQAERCAERFLRSLAACRPTESAFVSDAETFCADCFAKLSGEGSLECPEQYRDCDVLLMFDVEKFSGKVCAMEMFYSLFNSFCENGKQIVLFSAFAPYDIPKLEQRNLAQFEGCLIWSMDE